MARLHKGPSLKVLGVGTALATPRGSPGRRVVALKTVSPGPLRPLNPHLVLLSLDKRRRILPQ